MKCDQCTEEIDGIPTTFEFNEVLNFCNFHCLEAFDFDNFDEEDDEPTDSPSTPSEER